MRGTHIIQSWEQINTFIDFVNKNDMECSSILIWGLACFTGLRTSEICGLKYKDLNWQKKVITIKRIRDTNSSNVSRLNKQRIVAFPEPLMDIIRRVKEEQEFITNERVKSDDFIYRRAVDVEKGVLPDPAYISRCIKRDIDKLNHQREQDGKEPMEHIIIEDMRHSFMQHCEGNVDEIEQKYSIAGGSSTKDTGSRDSINKYIESVITINLKER